LQIGVHFVRLVGDCVKSRWRLEAEILVLRQRAPRLVLLRWDDRAPFIWLYRRFPRILDVVTIVRTETVVRALSHSPSRVDLRAKFGLTMTALTH
jgi:hypothetical protein